jgi:hypothetical protein
MDSPEEALARWFAHGVSSRTHPVLHWALTRYFHPLGIRAESLESEPFSALESGLGEWWLRRPRWDPGGIALDGPAARDFEVLRRAPGNFLVEVGPRGGLSIGLNPAVPADAAMAASWAESECGWRAARHAVRAAHEVDAFVYGAAGMILARDPLAEIYRGGDDSGFCEGVARVMNRP